MPSTVPSASVPSSLGLVSVRVRSAWSSAGSAKWTSAPLDRAMRCRSFRSVSSQSTVKRSDHAFGPLTRTAIESNNYSTVSSPAIPRSVWSCR